MDFQHNQEIRQMHVEYKRLVNSGKQAEANKLSAEIRDKHRAYYGKQPKPHHRVKKPGMLKHLYLLLRRLFSKDA